MIFDRNKGKGSSNPNKELQKLKRQDILELLLEQMRENDELRIAAAENRATIAELTALSDRLKDKLNDKDALIDRLKARLDGKDASIARFKAKLDDKDALLEAVYSCIHEVTEATTSRDRNKALLVIEDLFAGHFISQLKQHVEESAVEAPAEEQEEAPEVEAVEAEAVEPEAEETAEPEAVAIEYESEPVEPEAAEEAPEEEATE